jgi:flotillin
MIPMLLADMSAYLTIAMFAGGILFAIFLILFAIAKLYQKVGPNAVLVVSGGWSRVTSPDGAVLKKGFKIVQGGGTWVIPLIHRVQSLSLEILTIDVKTPPVQSNTGLPVIVEGVAQIKIKGVDASIITAAEMFLDKTPAEIMQVAHQTLEGHLRAIIGQITPVDLFREREKFAQEVQKISSTDFANMGLEVVSFAIKEIKDSLGYYDTLALQDKALMDRDTAIKRAEAERDAKIKSTDAMRAGEEVRARNQKAIQDYNREVEINAAENRAQAEKAKAIAARAGEIQDQIQLQVRKQEETKLAQLEVARRERELDATVREPAKAERDKINLAADAERYKLEAEAAGHGAAERNVGLGQGEAIKARGMAEADVVLARGQAEAQAMAKKAEAWRAYNEAAVAQMFIEKLPQVAEAVAKPLQQIEKIVMISNGGDGAGVGASRLTKEVIDIVTQLPPILEGVTGLNIKDMVQNLPRISKGEKGEKKA